jgi:hypothetical protein
LKSVDLGRRGSDGEDVTVTLTLSCGHKIAATGEWRKKNVAMAELERVERSTRMTGPIVGGGIQSLHAFSCPDCYDKVAVDINDEGHKQDRLL